MNSTLDYRFINLILSKIEENGGNKSIFEIDFIGGLH